MALSTDQRVELLKLSQGWGAGEPSTDLLALARGAGDDLLDELTADPGFSQTRAVAVRLVPYCVDEAPDRDRLLALAGEAVLRPVSEAQGMSRHPAWLGLCVIEIADLRAGWTEDPIGRAAEIAGRAFAAGGSAQDIDEGEVLWAMAEQAAEAGWWHRADPLFARALDASFADPVHRAQVRLLVAMRRVEQDLAADDLLALVFEDDSGLDRDRVQAGWILAHKRHERGESASAVQVLRGVAALVDRDDDPRVAQRIDALLAEWDS
jgi:hypothetical protein